MLDKVRQEMKHNHLDGLWVTDPASLNFLFGFQIDVGERFLGAYINQDSIQLVANKLFHVPQVHVHYYFDHENVYELIAKLTTGQRVGLDKLMEAHVVLELIKACPETEFVNGSDCVDKLRAIKTPEQIEKMIKASRVNDEVMKLISKEIRVGMSEIQIRDRIEELFDEFGTQPSFTTIVAFGDNGTDPHAIPSHRQLKEGESIIIDMGCVVDGYCSDMTRTFFINDNPIKEIYDLVLKANEAAIEAIKPGVSFSEIDGVARQIITEGGYGDYFIHRLGHGIGQQVHEPYDVSASNHQLIEPGMCFSIEPGIYKPGVDAVRIEDLVFVDETGHAVLLNHVVKNEPVILYRD